MKLEALSKFLKSVIKGTVIHKRAANEKSAVTETEAKVDERITDEL
jgi:hypothetical protein